MVLRLGQELPAQPRARLIGRKPEAVREVARYLALGVGVGLLVTVSTVMSCRFLVGWLGWWIWWSGAENEEAAGFSEPGGLVEEVI